MTTIELLNRACSLAAQAKSASAFSPEVAKYFQRLSDGWKRDYRAAKAYGGAK